jgi:hypothetical protein
MNTMTRKNLIGGLRLFTMKSKVDCFTVLKMVEIFTVKYKCISPEMAGWG